MKIKIQNDVIVHQSAGLSVGEDVRITIKISNQCFKAVKCEYSAFKVARRQLFLMLTPGPLQRPIFVLAPGPFFVLSAIVQNSFFDRSIVVFKSKSRHNHKVILYDVNQCFKAVKCEYSAFKVARRQLFLMLTPGPLQWPIFVLAPGPFFVLSAISKSRRNHKVLRVGPHRGHGLQCYASITDDQ